MKRSLGPDTIREAGKRLEQAHAALARRYPGESGRRQPVHTVYGGAHLFKADIARRLGDSALRSLLEFAPNFLSFAKAIGLPGSVSLPDSPERAAALEERWKADPDALRREDKPACLSCPIYNRVREKCRRGPVEDFRIDFEDGYGNRPEAEEDGHAESAAMEVVRGMEAATLPPFIGIRIKPFNEEL